MVQVAFFKIDLERLNQVPNLGLLLQLLATYNDINSLGHFGNTLTEQWNAQRAADEWVNDKFFESLAWYLFKLRVSSAADGLRNIVLDIKVAEQTNSMPEFWSLIKANPLIEKHYRILEDYLPPRDRANPPIQAGKYYPELKNQLFLRDKMTGHHDKQPLLDALTAAIAEHKAANKPSCDGWVQDGGHGQYTRALFVDNLQLISWYQSNGVQLNFAGYDNDPRVNQAGEHIKTMLGAFVNFVNELTMAYLNEHKLLKPAGKPEWIKN